MTMTLEDRFSRIYSIRGKDILKSICLDAGYYLTGSGYNLVPAISLCLIQGIIGILYELIKFGCICRKI